MIWSDLEAFAADSEAFKDLTGSLPTIDQLVTFALHKRGRATPQDPGLFDVVMLDVLREPLEEWLLSRGLRLAKIPPTNPDDIPTFTTTPTDEFIVHYPERT